MRSVYSGQRKIAGRQDIDAWIDVEVVLFRYHFEVGQSRGDLMRIWSHVNRIPNSIVAWMSNPLRAGHELPLSVCPKRVAHSAVTTSNPNPLLGNRDSYRLKLLRLDLAHRINRNQEALPINKLSIGKRIQRVRNCYVKPLAHQQVAEEISHFLWLMSIPSAPNN